MREVELLTERMLQRLARENRQLLALLRLGYTLRRAERLLEEAAASRGDAEVLELPACGGRLHNS
ncbi:MAG: hypothetical protein LLG44_00995 [Chloroflexi bacterium]|nr:hypothetical protein [Chloroflexota bacterium]